MAPKYTLHYFQVPARGEFIRIIFNHAGVEFQDLTFPAKEISKIKDDGMDTRFISAGFYLLKVNNRNTRSKCEICSKLIIKTPERRHYAIGVVLASLLLTLNIFHTMI